MNNEDITRRGFVGASAGTVMGLAAMSHMTETAWGSETKVGDTQLHKATRATFEPHLGTRFCVSRDGQSIEATLKHVADIKVKNARLPRRPFSLVFQGSGNKTLAQNTYVVQHEQLGKFHLFITPVGPNAGEYEAVIS